MDPTVLYSWSSAGGNRYSTGSGAELLLLSSWFCRGVLLRANSVQASPLGMKIGCPLSIETRLLYVKSPIFQAWLWLGSVCPLELRQTPCASYFLIRWGVRDYLSEKVHFAITN